VQSLQAQTDEAWVCLISDDCSSPPRFAEIERVIAGDPRFQASRSPDRLGFYRNFERALAMIPDTATLVALCDQDDRWHPQKLAVLRAAIGDAMLVYCDQRLITADGRVLRDTLWKGRRNNHTNLASLLIANSITGAATLMRREVVSLALPFPEVPGYKFHDHWIGLVALAAGEIAYVDRSLYDYVQHRGAVFGDVAVGAPGRPRRPAHSLVDRSRAAYFYGFRSRVVQAEVLLDRCAPRLTPRKRRVLRRFIDSERSPLAFAWLLMRTLRCLAGHNETLGSELELAQGIVWKRLAALPVRPRRGAPAGPPPLDAFSQERLRRWRSAV
jgi:glycosyltransferase involved in cell wall biosynthesis